MPDPPVIAAYIARRLQQQHLDEVSAVDAAAWLDEAGLLKDSASRPGLPLRNLLRAGLIPQAQQRPPTSNGRWFIVRTSDMPQAPSARGTKRGSPPRGDGVCAVSADIDSSASSSRARLQSVSDGSHDPVRQQHGDWFTRTGLSARGFVGFESFKDIDLSHVPTAAGVYVVLRESDSQPVFLGQSPAGWFKGQDPTVPVADLAAGWPNGAHCVYIGMAGPGKTGRRGLRKRITEFRQFGDGQPVGHRGGRRIWQLGDADDYIIGWMPTPGLDPAAVEEDLLKSFVAVHGKRPIGNRTGGRPR